MEEKISYPFGKMLKRMILNISKQNKKIFLYFIIYTIAASIYPFFAVILPKLLISELTLGDAVNKYYILAIILGYLLVTGVFGFIRTYVKDSTHPRISRLRIDYIRDMFDKIVSVDYQYMENVNFYEKYDRALGSVRSNFNGVEGVYHKLFETPSLFITILILTVFIGTLSIWIMVGLILNIAITMWINKRVHSNQYSMRDKLSNAERKKQYYYVTTHDFGFGKDIRIYNFKERIIFNYNKEIAGYVNIHKQIKHKEYLLGFLGLASLLISDAITYGIIIYKAANGMSIADFSMYLIAIVSLSLLLKTFTTNVSYIINEGQYVHDFYEFMDKDLGEIGGDKSAIIGETLEIQFNDVSFKYPNSDRYIFKNLNFTINKGERLAIVGINGAGKSTLVKLMTGLFDVTEGEILINRTPLKEFNKKELFSMFSVVFQEVNVLAFNIRENITCTSTSVNENRVMEVLNKVGLGEKIKEFPNGIDQLMLKIIDKDGTEFSGGENQKLAIARALYKDGNMIIMDEPTAALDALAEAEIYQNFNELVQGKTAVYISHRLASTKFCDKIALFDNDGLREYGNHEELMQQRGSYYEMFMIQGKYYNEGGSSNEQYQEA